MRRRPTCLTLAALLIGSLLWAGHASAQNREWTWYKNKSYDNAIEVPKDLFIKTSGASLRETYLLLGTTTVAALDDTFASATTAKSWMTMTSAATSSRIGAGAVLLARARAAGGEPIAEAEVRLYSDGGVRMPSVTDRNGEACMAGAPSGPNALTIRSGAFSYGRVLDLHVDAVVVVDVTVD